MKSINFELPELRNKNIKAVKQYLAPFRKQGIRTQYELINDKHITHNYGHGTNGFDLAYGTAFVAIKAMMIKIDTNVAHNVAILGTGIIAVMTAIQLIKRGFRVTLYGQQPLALLNMDQKTQKSAPMGYSLWFPDGYDYTQDLLKHELITKFSYDYLQQCIRYKRYRSISQTSVFEFNRSVQELRQCVSDLVFDNYRVVNLQYENKQQEQVVQYHTLVIDNSLFYEELKTELILRGGKYVKQKFNNLNDVLSLKQTVIMNCLGPQSKNIFADQNLVPKPVIEVDLETDPNENNKNWHIRLHFQNQENYEVVSRNGNLKIILPAKKDAEQKNETFIESHLLKIDSFFQTRRSQTPKL